MGLYDINEIYKPLYVTDKRFTIVTGGRGSLKSHSVHDFILRLTYEHGQGILFTRYTMTSAEKSIIPEFNLALERLDVSEHFEVTKTTIVNKLTNSFIWFSGIKTSSGDQTGNLKSISGITTWVIEEGEDFIDEAKFDTINRSIRTANKQNRIIWVMNPTTPQHFIYGKFFEGHEAHLNVDGFNVVTTKHPKVEHIHTTYHIGKEYLSEDWLEEAEYYRVRAKDGIDKYTGKKLNELEKEKAVKYYVNQYLGGWRTQQEGVIFTDWEYGEFPTDLPYIYGLDFGVNDPDALIKVAVNKRKNTIYLKECIYQNGLSTDELYDLVKRHTGKSLIVADVAGKRTIMDLKRKGLNVTKCRKGAGSVVEGIKKMTGFKLVIEGANIAKELNNYTWLTNSKKENPIDDFNHAIDAARYAFMHLLRPSSAVRV